MDWRPLACWGFNQQIKKGAFFHSENWLVSIFSISNLNFRFVYFFRMVRLDTIQQLQNPNKTKASTGVMALTVMDMHHQGIHVFFIIVSFLNMILSSIWSWGDVDVTLKHFLHVFDKLKRSGRVNGSTQYPHHHYICHHHHYLYYFYYNLNKSHHHNRHSPHPWVNGSMQHPQAPHHHIGGRAG